MSNLIGKTIKKLRKQRGSTRKELANELGVSYSTIAMYEYGEREPNIALIVKLCKFFHCSADYLIGLTSNKEIIKEYKNVLEIKADGKPVKFKLNGIPLKKVCSYKLNHNEYCKNLTITIDIDEMYSI